MSTQLSKIKDEGYNSAMQILPVYKQNMTNLKNSGSNYMENILKYFYTTPLKTIGDIIRSLVSPSVAI